jgi:hypothetical protein
MQQIGRAIDVARDTGALTKTDEIAEAAEKQAWKDKRQTKNLEEGVSNLSVASVLQTTLTTQLLLEHGDPALKQRILKDLMMSYDKENARQRSIATSSKKACNSSRSMFTPETITSPEPSTTSPAATMTSDCESDSKGSFQSDSDSEDEDDIVRREVHQPKTLKF